MGRSDGQPYSPHAVCCAAMPHWPDHTGSDAARPAANRHAAATARTTRPSFPTNRPLCSKEGGISPPSLRTAYRAPLLVERSLDLRNLLGFEVRAWLGGLVARLDLTAEVESQPGEGVGTVAADLLERGEELLLGLRPRERARRHLVRGTDLDRPVPLQAGCRRDELPDDDVLLEPEQPVDLALDRRIGQHLRRLLERRGREERLRCERRLRDPEDQRLGGRLLLLLLLDPRVLTLEHDLVDELSRQEVGVAVVLDPHLLQHLPDDQF